jgi:hypothetical protein
LSFEFGAAEYKTAIGTTSQARQKPGRSGPRLRLTDAGRRFAGTTTFRHGVKRAERLLGNRHLQHEAASISAGLWRVLAGIGEPLILVDWSDLKADRSLHLLRASFPVGGHGLTLYKEVHPQKKLGNRAVQQHFLQCMAALLLAQAAFPTSCRAPDGGPVRAASRGVRSGLSFCL